MKVDFSTVIEDIETGKPVPESDRPNAAPSTISLLCVRALLVPHPADAELKGEEKIERFNLARRIKGATEPLDITPEEATLIRSLVNRAFSTLIVAQVWAAIA